jgi:signal-transduction protein with cAMP-binding, CBS, and nucleotidyltransferase domain
MKVAELMRTPAVTIGPRATLRAAAENMRTHNVGCLVVLDQMGYLAGIVTDRDITIRGVGAGRTADASVEAVMTRDVATVPPNADVGTAAMTMRKRSVRRVVVADDMWRPMGMIAMDDVLRTVGHEMDTVTDAMANQTTRVIR